MRRRRRPKLAWFPTLGTSVPGDPDWCGRSFFQDVPSDGSLLAQAQPLVPDLPLEGGQVDQISQALEQDYVIKRIVGKVHASFIPQETAEGGVFGVSTFVAARLTVGLFVARANGDPAVGDGNVPIGGGTLVGTTNDYNPASIAQIREPWMWRRTWILSNIAANFVAAPASALLLEGVSYPSDTAGYGSVLDGPHMDVKVGRRIGNDDRLWIGIATQGYPVGLALSGGGLITTSQVRIEFDYRVLGQLRRAHNRSTF